MKTRAALGVSIGLVALLASGCQRSPYARVEEGKRFPLLDSLPGPLQKDDWKTLRWINLDAKRMSKDGGSCFGHAGIIERESDHERWLLIGAVCGANTLTTSTGAKLDSRALTSLGEGDVVTSFDARFVEALEKGSYVLWTSTHLTFEKDQGEAFDETVVARDQNQLRVLLEIGHDNLTGSGFEGDDYPREFVVKVPNGEQRLGYDPLKRRYGHKSLRSFFPDAPLDAGAPAFDADAAAAPPGDAGAGSVIRINDGHDHHDHDGHDHHGHDHAHDASSPKPDAAPP